MVGRQQRNLPLVAQPRTAMQQAERTQNPGRVSDRVRPFLVGRKWVSESSACLELIPGYQVCKPGPVPPSFFAPPTPASTQAGHACWDGRENYLMAPSVCASLPRRAGDGQSCLHPCPGRGLQSSCCLQQCCRKSWSTTALILFSFAVYQAQHKVAGWVVGRGGDRQTQRHSSHFLPPPAHPSKHLVHLV